MNNLQKPPSRARKLSMVAQLSIENQRSREEQRQQRKDKESGHKKGSRATKSTTKSTPAAATTTKRKTTASKTNTQKKQRTQSTNNKKKKQHNNSSDSNSSTSDSDDSASSINSRTQGRTKHSRQQKKDAVAAQPVFTAEELGDQNPKIVLQISLYKKNSKPHFEGSTWLQDVEARNEVGKNATVFETELTYQDKFNDLVNTINDLIGENTDDKFELREEKFYVPYDERQSKQYLETADHTKKTNLFHIENETHWKEVLAKKSYYHFDPSTFDSDSDNDDGDGPEVVQIPNYLTSIHVNLLCVVVKARTKKKKKQPQQLRDNDNDDDNDDEEEEEEGDGRSETTLKCVLLPPARKVSKNGIENVELAAVNFEDCPSLELLPQQDGLKLGYLLRKMKTLAVNSDLYAANDDDVTGTSWCGKNSTLYFQRNWGTKKLSKLTSSADLWAHVFDRQKKSPPAERKKVEIRLSIGAKKPDDIDYVVPYDLAAEEEQTPEDFTFSQDSVAQQLQSPSA